MPRFASLPIPEIYAMVVISILNSKLVSKGYLIEFNFRQQNIQMDMDNSVIFLGHRLLANRWHALGIESMGVLSIGV